MTENIFRIRGVPPPLPLKKKCAKYFLKGSLLNVTFLETQFQMLSPLDETELAAAWRRAAGPDGKVPVSLYFDTLVGNKSY